MLCRRSHMMPAIVPDINALRSSVSRDAAPPSGLPPALQSLWLEAKGEVDAARDALTGDDHRNLAWVRAHLCRASGDTAASDHWYAAAARPVVAAGVDVEQEWAEIATVMLTEMLQRGLVDTTDESEAAATAAASMTNPTEYLEALGMRSIPHGSRQADMENGTFMDHLSIYLYVFN